MTLINQELSEKKLSQDLADYLLTKSVIRFKAGNKIDESLEKLKDSIFLNNIGTMKILLASLTPEQKKNLISIAEKNIGLNNKAKYLCPYFRLNQRQARAEFLWQIVNSYQLKNETQASVFNELYVDIPEVFSSKILEKNADFKLWLNKELSWQLLEKRMINLMLFGQSQEAKENYEEFLKKKGEKLDQAGKCALDYQSAKISRQQKKYAHARSEFSQLGLVCPEPIKTNALFMETRLLAMAQDWGQLDKFDNFLKLYPTHTFTDDVLMFKAKMAKDLGKTQEYLSTLEQIIKLFPKGDMINEALFLQALAHAEAGKTDKAIKSLAQLKKLLSKDSLEEHQASYWLLRLKFFPDLKKITSSLNKADKKADQDFKTLVYSQKPSVYSWLALDLAKNLGLKLSPPKNAYKDKNLKFNDLDKDINLIKEMLNHDLIDDALLVLQESEVNGDINRALALGEILIAHNQGALAYQKILMCDLVVAEKVFNLSPSLWEKIALAKAFAPEINKISKENNLDDADLVFSLVRRESGFLAQARSWAQARGLMQLMMPTAKDQAKLLKIELINEEELFEPVKNLKLGIGLVKRLMGKYNNNLAYVLSAYNGGPGSTNKWIKNNRGCPVDVYLENIGFTETKAYVKNILGGYFHYLLKNKGASSVPSLLNQPNEPLK